MGALPHKEWHYEVTVWNQTNGDIEEHIRDATKAELAECHERYKDEPWCDVVIDRSWEEAADDEDVPASEAIRRA